MTRSVTRKTAQPPTDNPSRSRATWVFGSLLLVFSVWVFIFAPDTLPEYKHRMLGIFLALLSGLFAFFLTGDMGLEIKSLESRFGKVGVKATGGIAVFALVLWWWSSPLAPIGVEKKLGEIKALLEQELSFKNTQIEFLQGHIEKLQAQVPSPRALELAAQVPADSDPYALALKAIAESRLDDARRLLGEAERNKEAELAKIYLAHARTEAFAGQYTDAIGWYWKALSLKPDDPYILNETAFTLMYAGKYAEAEALFKRSLAIRKQLLAAREKFLGPKHPEVAPIPDGLAFLYHIQGRYAEAEPLYKQSLEIGEKVLGSDSLYMASILNRLAVLYYTQGKFAEAQPFSQRALAIREKALGPEHPDVATSLNNLAELYYAQGQYAEAEPLLQRALMIWEKSLGPGHPGVGKILNNLAQLYHDQGKYDEAKPLFLRAITIVEKALGPDHPYMAHIFNNLAKLYYSQGDYVQAESFYRRAIEIDRKNLGSNHSHEAKVLNNYALLYETQGKYAKAESFYRQALTIREKILGPDHPDVAITLKNYAVLLQKTNREAKAEKLEARAQAICEKRAKENLAKSE